MTRFKTMLLAALLGAAGVAPLAAGWGNDAAQEPSSIYDLEKYMWPEANDRAAYDAAGAAEERDRIYFNVHIERAALGNTNVDGTGQGMSDLNGRLHPTPLMRFSGFLGFWRDCNNDGYIGDRTTGAPNYPADSADVDLVVCPEGEIHNHLDYLPGSVTTPEDVEGNDVPGDPTRVDVFAPVGYMIHEFVSIGPDGRDPEDIPIWSVNDTEARVWGDINLPTEAPARTARITPLPAGTLDSWYGNAKYLDDLMFQRFSDTYQQVYDTVAPELPAGGEHVPTSFFAIADTLDDTAPAPTGIVLHHYGQESGDPGDEGDPMVSPWSCADEEDDTRPTFEPEVDADGSAGDSINATVKGLVFHVPTGVQNENASFYDGQYLYVGQGCNKETDGETEDPLFPDGLSLYQLFEPQSRHFETEVDVKTSTNMYFSYFATRNQSANQVVARAPPNPWPVGFGGVWTGQPTYVSQGTMRNASYYVFYAKVDVDKYPATAFPGAKLGGGEPKVPEFVYGQEACFDTPAPHNGWGCDMTVHGAAWEKAQAETPDWRVLLYETYQLRDTDCTDMTAAAPGTTNPAFQSIDDEYTSTYEGFTEGSPPSVPGVANLEHIWFGFCK